MNKTKHQDFTILRLLSFLIATSFCSYAQDSDSSDIDSLLDEFFFEEQQFLDEILEGDLSYQFLYSNVSYNTNTYFSGRSSGVNQFNIIPQISYYHSSGFSASISGVYYQNFDPTWDFTSISLGYFNTLDKQKNLFYNLGYTRFLYTDGSNTFNNSIDISLGVRSNKRNLGSTLSGSYLFGSDSSFQLISNSYFNLDIFRNPKFAIRFRPNLSFIVAKQVVTILRPKRIFPGTGIEQISENIFDLLNTQMSLPITLTTKSWDFEISFTQNLPNALPNESELTNTNFFSFSVGYMFDLNK
ncbi:MAG: hypothetical protein P8P88_04090 [Polaribacter sp.]|nr:hypothetical protein [Polaribacter sp.]